MPTSRPATSPLLALAAARTAARRAAGAACLGAAASRPLLRQGRAAACGRPGAAQGAVWTVQIAMGSPLQWDGLWNVISTAPGCCQAMGSASRRP